MTLRIETLTRADLDAIQLRPEDAREVSPGWKESALGPASCAALDDQGRVVAIGGAVLGPEEVGVWLLCSDLVGNHRVTLGRAILRVLEALRQDSRLVFNYIPKDSHGNRRFVERLGFRILPSPGEGPDFFYLPN